jgi:ParB family transcriptional regulator, chromosome partitioning protein
MNQEQRRQLLKSTMKDEASSLHNRFAKADLILGTQSNQHTGDPLAFARAARQPITVEPSMVELVDPQQGRVTHKISVHKLEDNPYNARQIYDSNEIVKLAASLATHGQLVPGLAVPNTEKLGYYLLVDGHYRKRALKYAGKTEMDCFLDSPKTSLELYRTSFMLNEQRNAQSTLDNALAWRRLLKDKTVTKEEDLCELTGFSWGQINKTLALLKLPETVIDRMQEHPGTFGVAMGYELYLYNKAAGEVECLKLVDRVLAEGLSYRDVETIRKKLQAGAQRKRKEVSRQHKIYLQGQQVGVIKDWDTGRILVDLRIQDPEKQQEIVDSLRRLMSTSTGS